jgi:hypothetical protein
MSFLESWRDETRVFDSLLRARTCGDELVEPVQAHAVRRQHRACAAVLQGQPCCAPRACCPSAAQPCLTARDTVGLADLQE